MRPIIVLTSNNYRELSDALRRRCGYLYLEQKTVEEMQQIIMKKAEVDDTIALAIANCVEKIRQLPMRQVPSIAEAVVWADYLKSEGETVTKQTLDDSIFMLVKNQQDRDVVRANLDHLLIGA